MLRSKDEQVYDDLQMYNFIHSVLKPVPGGSQPNEQTERQEREMRAQEIRLKAKGAVTSNQDK